MTPATPPGHRWIVGYGSLVAAHSLAATIGRTPDALAGRRTVHLHGFGRRWNYGSLHLRGDWLHAGTRVENGLVVSLGLVPAPDEVCNGVAHLVTDDELALLDWRERDYDRTDVTDRVLDDGGVPLPGPVVTYVPRASAIERYEAARDRGRAAIRRSYRELVHEAFVALGPDHCAAWERTPAPDVPVLDITLGPARAARPRARRPAG